MLTDIKGLLVFVSFTNQIVLEYFDLFFVLY